MPRLTITDVAKAVGVHKSTVSRQARASGLVGSDGLVDLDAYRALRATGLDPALQTSGPEAGGMPARRATADADAGTLQAERTRKMAADAQLAELTLARQRGELLERDQVERVQEDRARSLRQRILMVPRAVASDLALLSDPKAIAGHLTIVLESALTEEHDALLRGAA
jgi:phage terminase Nu1 subunit (DNA packaging protein)